MTAFLHKTWNYFMHDSLRRNSTFLIVSQGISAGIGFVFWLICARLFSVHEVGLAAAFIAYGVMFSTFTNLGISNTIIRFMPKSRNKLGLLNATLLVVTLASILGSIAALILIDRIAPTLSFITTATLGIIALSGIILFSTLNNVSDSLLISTKSGGIVLGKTIVNSSGKLVLILLFTGFGVAGIISSHIIALGLGVVFAIFYAYKLAGYRTKGTPNIDMAQLYEHKGFAAGNFFGSIVGVLPSSLLPIIVLNQLGAEYAAYFFVAFQLSTFLNLVSSSTTQAIFAESSHSDSDDQVITHLKKGAIHLYQILIPAILVLGIGGGFILSIYGKNYLDNAYPVLIILLISSIFIGINWLGDTWLNIRKRMRQFFAMNLLNSVLVIGLVYLFSPGGLVWVGAGWLIAQMLSAVVYLVMFKIRLADVRH